MYARQTIASIKPERFEEALGLIKEAFVPDARQQQGYRGFLVFSNRDAHELMGITLWDDASNLGHSSGSSGYYRERMEEFGRTVAAPPVTKVWVVETVDEVAK